MQKYYPEDGLSGLKHLKYCDFRSYNAYFSRKIFQNYRIYKCYDISAMTWKNINKDVFSGLKTPQIWRFQMLHRLFLLFFL